MTAGKIAELVSIGIAFGACLMWVGATANDLQTTKEEVKQVKVDIKATPADVAVLQSQVTTMQGTIGEIKTEQAKQDDKLDRILEEVRRR